MEVKSLNQYKKFKVGDCVKRVTGTDVHGKPWNTEGIIVDIKQWESGKVYFLVAEKGNLCREVILFPSQVKKIDKEFKINENGKLKLF